MIERHALWSAVASNRGYMTDTEEKQIALDRWNEVLFCEKFHCTREYYRSLPADWVADAIEILNIRDHYANKKSSP